MILHLQPVSCCYISTNIKWRKQFIPSTATQDSGWKVSPRLRFVGRHLLRVCHITAFSCILACKTTIGLNWKVHNFMNNQAPLDVSTRKWYSKNSGVWLNLRFWTVCRFEDIHFVTWIYYWALHLAGRLHIVRCRLSSLSLSVSFSFCLRSTHPGWQNSERKGQFWGFSSPLRMHCNAFAANGIGREEGDGSAQRGWSVVYSCLVNNLWGRLLFKY